MTTIRARVARAAAVAVAVLVVAMGHVSAVVAGATPIPPVDWPELPDVRGRAPVFTTENFVVHAEDPEDDLLLGMVRVWAPRLEGILAADARRAGRGLARGRVHVVFARAYEARCPARGLAAPASDPPLIVVYVTPGTTARHVAGVLAHEIAHQIAATEDFVGDGILTEGLANWIADEAMLRWLGLPSWDAAVRRALARGTYVSLLHEFPLSPAPNEDCLERRDRVYAIRTSFVGWLVDRYGLETVLAMPYREIRTVDADGQSVTRREPDYRAATGSALPELERRWLRDVLRGGSVDALMVRSETDADGRGVPRRGGAM